jgi:beta-glucanase (GH16 family)
VVSVAHRLISVSTEFTRANLAGSPRSIAAVSFGTRCSRAEGDVMYADSIPRRRGRWLARLALLAGALVVIGLVRVILPSDLAAPTLLSLGRPTTASSAESEAFLATAATDGDPGTRWSSGFSDPQWIQVDLGSTQAISQVRLSWETAYVKAFAIQTSTDGTSWTNAYRTTTGAGGDQTVNVSAHARYVRVNGTQRVTQWGYSLWEFQVFGGGMTTAEDGDVLISYKKPGVASTTQDDVNCGHCVEAGAFDFDPATRWATSSTTGWADPGWIYVDLGATADIHKVVLQWDQAYATTYQIQISNDANNWTPIYTTAAGKGFKETLKVTGTGRYVRMYGTARSNGYGYSLWEFQVWGTGGVPNAQPTVPPGPSVPGTLVWSDEFNGPPGTTPDPAKWTADTGPGVNNELEYYTENNNAKQDGAGGLVLQARREVTPGSTCPPDPISGSTTCQYTSARINTGGKFSFTYGHVGARIKVSGTQGLWPAFWLLGSNFFDKTANWPNCGEIDIMEHVGTEPTKSYSTIHAPAYHGADGIGLAEDLGTDVSAAFHVFGVDWDSTHMTFTVDGNAFETINRDNLESTRGPWVFDHPFSIILNNAIGGDFPGPVDAGTVLPQNMVVDYVRVYR